MEHEPTATDPRGNASPVDDARPWLHDCWLIEVMPPTWAWACRRLLNAGTTDGHSAPHIP